MAAPDAQCPCSEMSAPLQGKCDQFLHDRVLVTSQLRNHCTCRARSPSCGAEKGLLEVSTDS